MATLTEGKHPGEFILSEANGDRSRDAVVVASGNTLVACQVIGKVTASGKMAAFDQDAVDGTENAAGVIFAGVDASAADADGVAIVRDAEVVADDLVWPGDIEQGEKDAAIAQLKALGILVR